METKTYKLKDIAISIFDGVHNSVLDNENGDCFLLSAKNIKNGIISFDQTDRKIDKSTRDKLSKRTNLAKDDVLVTTVGTVGELAIVDENYQKYEFQRSVGIIKCNQEIVLPQYLYYLLKTESYNYYLHVVATGAAQPCIFLSTLKNIKVKLPNLHVQSDVLSVLSKYDKLINNYKEQIENLQNLAGELYKEWFVRFRFPGHEKATFENGIPVGWNKEKLTHFGKVITGKTPPTEISDYYGEDVMFVKTPDMHNEIYVQQTSEYLSKKGSDFQKAQFIPKNSIMVSCIGTGGVVAINAYPAHTNQQINSIILDDLTYLPWLYFTIKSMKETIIMFGNTGTTMTNLSKGKFERLKVICPKHGIVNKFESIAMPVFEKLLNLSAEIANLSKQRDLLLPRLMSGKLEVK